VGRHTTWQLGAAAWVRAWHGRAMAAVHDILVGPDCFAGVFSSAAQLARRWCSRMLRNETGTQGSSASSTCRGLSGLRSWPSHSPRGRSRSTATQLRQSSYGALLRALELTPGCCLVRSNRRLAREMGCVVAGWEDLVEQGRGRCRTGQRGAEPNRSADRVLVLSGQQNSWPETASAHPPAPCPTWTAKRERPCHELRLAARSPSPCAL